MGNGCSRLAAQWFAAGALSVGSPLLAAMMWGANSRMLAVTVMSLALIAKHWQNLQRLLTGTEPKLGAKKKDRKDGKG